jgi:hypothetical protein
VNEEDGIEQWAEIRILRSWATHLPVANGGRAGASCRRERRNPTADLTPGHPIGVTRLYKCSTNE